MTKVEFEKEYSKRSDITLEFYHERFVTLPCNCKADMCNGLACVSNNKQSIKTHNDLYI